MNRSSDPYFQTLADIAKRLHEEFVPQKVSLWKDSPFAWMVTLPSSVKGRLGKQLVMEWCRAHGFAVEDSPDSEADIVVNGQRVEVKFSTLWGSGEYVFQQIRDYNYDFLLCLGVSPSDAALWFIPKDVVFGPVEREGLAPQHTGRRGRETKWLRVRAQEPFPWMEPYGGKLDVALQVLRKFAPPNK